MYIIYLIAKEIFMTQPAAVYTAFCAAIALTACLAPPHPLTELISDLAVLTMITLWFSALESSKTAEIAEFSLKIVFIALCAKSGGVMLHAAALITDHILEKQRFIIP